MLNDFKPFVKVEREIYNVKDIESYGDIVILYGQYAGCRIKDIINGDLEYSKWLYENSISKNEYNSPTSKAICKYFKHKIELLDCI